MASSSIRKRNYDAFLSFSADVRQNFVAPLYEELVRVGLDIFLDTTELRKGEQISWMIMEAIEKSRIAIIIFSEDYASLQRCLEELVKIMECGEQKGLIILPVFYKVEPREVRTGGESYGVALAKHESRLGKESRKVRRWKQALSYCAKITGWSFYGGDESKLIQGIVKEVCTRLDRTPLFVAKHLVGMSSRVAKVKSMLNLESNDDVIMVGLWGQGGIGKTTIAKALYNDIFREYEDSCFLSNVREASNDSEGLVTLQKQLLSKILSQRQRLEMFSVDRGTHLIRDRLGHKKVLLVLDDVDNLRQLIALAGEGKFFGYGSRIIVTSRDKHLLTSYGIDRVYEVEALDDIEARELFRNLTFTTHQKAEIKTDLVDRVLNHVGGLPLALEVVGSSLCGGREGEWEMILKKLSRNPNKMINNVLKISYDGLEEDVKEIFLHIACFFNLWNSEYVKDVLNSCDLAATIGFEILIQKSLIRIDECGLLQMPTLIQLMGMDIVRQECPDDPGRRSRLWLYDDVVDLLSSDLENCDVRAIVLDLPEPKDIYIGPNTFTKMKRLRLLIMRNVRNSFLDPICYPEKLGYFEWAQLASSTPKFSSGPVGLDMSKRSITEEPKQFKASVATIEHVIGIDDQVKKVIKLLDLEDDEVGVRIVGIHGTDGIGKTTIAKAVYDRLSSCFNSCSFLAEIKETEENVNIQFVQNKLICDILERDCDVASFEGGIEFFLEVFHNIRVLIVLDDVEDQSHLYNLVGKQLDWFGLGSRIIVTSENREILQEYGALACTHEVNGMDKDQAIELLCKHALAINSSGSDYIETMKRMTEATGEVPFAIEVNRHYVESAERIIKASGQVPFVIEVIGSFLRGKPIEYWRMIEDSIGPQEENSQERLKDCREILKICYDSLDEKQKQIFWDIAWFANGVDSRIASCMWPDQELSPSHHVLMPLAKIGGDNMLWMHKMLRCRGRPIHQEETKYMLVKDLKEFNRKKGMEEVEVLCFDLKDHRHTFTETDFKSMPKIRFLKFDHESMTGNFANVFRKLRWLRWQGCSRDFAAAECSLIELVILDLSWSKVTEDWGVWRKIKMEQLKVLNLTGCTDLLISPEFSSFPKLEILILERCSRLFQLDPSVCGLDKLLCLNLKSCTELNRLPAELGALKALKELLIDETSVRDIPFGSDSKKVEHLTSLSILSADNSKITALPSGVGGKLRSLSLRNCHWIQNLPESIGQVGSPLEELDISGTGISELPDSFSNLHRLTVLKMDNCFISNFPSFIWHLHGLEEIHASTCRNLREIPDDIGKLKNLRILRLRYSAITELPSVIEYLSKLEILDVLHCNKLHKLPALPSGLLIVHLSPKLRENAKLSGKHCFITK